ncbi:MAG TPA: hypothetical protein DCW90_11840, partial [Lachnospiraceae bacterium]|nr:hypothetical protein [Lachnospiraceae bacterium]
MVTDLFEFDQLQMYFGYDYVINEHIKIHQPKIREIVAQGEKDYFSTVYTLTAIPSDMKFQLFEMGLDW